MNENTQQRLQQLIENRDQIKSAFSWDSGLVHLACAGIYTVKDQSVDKRVLKNCREIIKKKIGAFSNFRSSTCAPIAAMMAISENPEETLDNGVAVYELLKKKFWSSTYLPLVAMIIAQLAESDEYENIVVRTRAIYECMKAEHPFLTSSEDSAFCALMALSEKSNDGLMRDAEECYKILKKNFHPINAVQSLSHVLALCDGTAEFKCQRTMELFDQLKASGCKYGTEYELPTLGILALSGGNLEDIVHEMIEIDQWLSNQKGFGIFGNITKKQRLMYAGILAQKEYFQEDTMQTAALNGTISMIVAQEAALCAAISASVAVSSAASSN